MRKKILLMSFVLLGSSVFISCSKTGPAGSDGKDGLSGTNGINGIDGTTIYSGSGSPEASIGNVGDFYLDMTSVTLYGPKASSGWGTGVKLQGAKGTDGTNGINGTKIWSGNGLPQVEMGNIGDFYIDTTAVIIYGPKLSSADWGNQISLRNDSTAIKTYVLTGGFKNLQLELRTRDYQTRYYYDYDIASQTVFNNDDQDRRGKYKYFNNGYIPYGNNWGQITARGMDVSIRQNDLDIAPGIHLAVVGQPFRFLADSLNNTFIFTKEDSLRMASGEYPSPLITGVLDPTMKVGETMRYGEVKSEVDSLNSFQFSFVDTNKITVSKYISNFENIVQNGIIFVSLNVLPEFNYPASRNGSFASEYWDDFTKGATGLLNDSTMALVSIQKSDIDTFIIYTSLKTRNQQSGISLPGQVVPPLTGSAILGGRNYGSRSSNFTAKEFQGKQFYKIKLLVIPPAEVINLSARGVNVRDLKAVRRALKL